VIILVIYLNIDFSNFIEVFKNSNLKWLIISLSMVILTTFFSTLRFKQLIPGESRLSFTDLLGLILAANTMNMVLPSKMGDIAKAYFMKNKSSLDGPLSFSIVIFEKACDLLSLLLFCIFGLFAYHNDTKLFWILRIIVLLVLFSGIFILISKNFAGILFKFLQRLSPPRFKEKIVNMGSSWKRMQDYLIEDKKRLFLISLNSIFIWFLHLIQIWFFILALEQWVPFKYNLAFAPLSILVGLLPVTLAGIGTRDAAIILFYSPFLNPASSAALGILYTSRYIIPAIFGIPFFGKYLSDIKNKL
jgi:uncharacterized protein (TIRG00374 family)